MHVIAMKISFMWHKLIINVIQITSIIALIIIIINLIKVNTKIIEIMMMLWEQMIMLSKHVCFIKTLLHLAINFLSLINIVRINIRYIKIVFIFHKLNYHILNFIMKYFKTLMRCLCKIISTKIKLSIKAFIKQINSLNYY